MSLLNVALAYRKRGWNVLPLTQKTPRVEWARLQSRRLTDTEFRAAFRQGGLTGIAMLLGRTSCNTYARDFDFLESFERWKAEFSDFARALPISATPRPGIHVLSCGNVLKTTEFCDGELRGEGSLLVLPPSIVGDKPYNWINQLPPGDLLFNDPSEIGLSKSWTTIQPLHAVKAVKGRSEIRIAIGSIDDVIAISLPTRPRTNDAKAIVFAQSVRSLEKCLGRELSEDEKRVGIERWYAEASKRRCTRHPYECYEDEFLRACENIKYPLGFNPMTLAFENALSAVSPKIAIEMKLSPPATALATFFREAQRIAGSGKVFFVPYGALSKSIPSLRGTDSKNVWSICNTLERRGIIKIVDRGKPRCKEYPNGLAATFLYLHPLDDS